MKKLIVFISFLSSVAFSQQPKTLKLNYQIELGGYFSLTNKLPFWQATNQYGSIPDDLPALFLRQKIHSKPDSNRKFCRLNYGLETVVILGKKPMLILPEAYLDLKLGKIHLWTGRKKEILGLVDSTLSSGSITWSGNALPLPKVQFEIPNYTKLFVNWLSLKGTFSHAWFQNQTYSKDYYLHQKSLFFRLGKPESRLKLYSGFMHNVQWGGKPKYPLPEGDDRLLNGKFPEDWFVYGNVVLPINAIWKNNSKYEFYNKFERGNRFGNHLGSIDFAAEFKLKKVNMMLYRQFLFEDGQLFSLTNADDGLYGLSLKPDKTAFKKIVVEYLFTKNQGHYLSGIARLLGLEDRHPNEQNFYFNHAQYVDGWSYNRKTIGTPFLTPQENIRTEKQFNNGYVYVNNNRLWAINLGLDNQIGTVKFISRLSYSKNFGAYEIPFLPVSQISYCVNTIIPLKKLKADFNVNIAVDHGDLVKDNFGSYISIIKKW